MDYVKFEKIDLKSHAEFTEKWVQDRIAADPKMLGLGDVILKDKERIQPRAGRLDLLFQESEGNRRFEVELQLGPLDESHIIRTIEYWDIERKRYPQYDHTAVIIAEDITSRFLNVISLLNGTITLIAIQMSALKIGDSIGLFFTTVLDQINLGFVDEDEEVQETTDRAYWEKKATKQTVAMADEILELLREYDKALELKFNKFYVGIARDGRPDNFVIFRPKMNWITVEPKLKESDEIQNLLEAQGCDVMEYDKRWGRYRIRFKQGDVTKHQALLIKLLKDAGYLTTD
jgi:hypothetical protein